MTDDIEVTYGMESTSGNPRNTPIQNFKQISVNLYLNKMSTNASFTLGLLFSE